MGFEDFAGADELDADAVAEAGEGGVGDAGCAAESFEAVGDEVGAGVGVALVVG